MVNLYCFFDRKSNHSLIKIASELTKMGIDARFIKMPKRKNIVLEEMKSCIKKKYKVSNNDLLSLYIVANDITEEFVEDYPCLFKLKTGINMLVAINKQTIDDLIYHDISRNRNNAVKNYNTSFHKKEDLTEHSKEVQKLEAEYLNFVKSFWSNYFNTVTSKSETKEINMKPGDTIILKNKDGYQVRAIVRGFSRAEPFVNLIDPEDNEMLTSITKLRWYKNRGWGARLYAQMFLVSEILSEEK